MKLIEITSPDAWDGFHAAQPFAQFLQSWAWGQFRISRGSRVKRFALVDDAQAIIVAVQMEERVRKFGFTYWLAPRGPVFAASLDVASRRQCIEQLCQLLTTHAELRHRALFWRMEPAAELGQPDGLFPMSFRRTASLNPAATRVMHLAMSEEDMLKQMHEKTRYNIRLAERNSVTVRRGKGSADLDIFLRLMETTADRDGFVQHPSAYLAATFHALAPVGMASLRIAEHQGVPLAANMEMAFGDTLTYLYGASSNASRNVMAPYALQWHAMRDAKARGFARYDFWGENPELQGSYYYKDAWKGISRFKRGFGGQHVDMVGTWDLPLRPWIYAAMHPKNFFRD